MIFLSNPSVYTLPNTWEKQPLVEPGLAIPIFIGLIVIGLLGYGIYMTFGDWQIWIINPFRKLSIIVKDNSRP